MAPAVVRPLNLTKSEPETPRSAISNHLMTDQHTQQTSTPHRTPQVNPDSIRSSPRRRILETKSLVDVPVGAAAAAGLATATAPQLDGAPAPQFDRAPSSEEQRANAAESKVAQLEKEIAETKMAQLQKELEAERQKSKAAEEGRLVAVTAAAQAQVAAAQAAQTAAAAAQQAAVQHTTAAVKPAEEEPTGAVAVLSTAPSLVSQQAQQNVSAASQIHSTPSNVPTNAAVSVAAAGGTAVGVQEGEGSISLGAATAGSRSSGDSPSKKAEKKVIHGDPSIPAEYRDMEHVSSEPTALPSAAPARAQSPVRAQSPGKKTRYGDPSIPPEFRYMEDSTDNAAHASTTRAQKAQRPKLRALNQPKPAVAGHEARHPAPTATPAAAAHNAGAGVVPSKKDRVVEGMNKIRVQELSKDGGGVIDIEKWVPDTDAKAAHARQQSIFADAVSEAAAAPGSVAAPLTLVAAPLILEASPSSQQLFQAALGEPIKVDAAGRRVKGTKLKVLPRMHQPKP